MISIVLENATHPGNIGATARAMYTMGFMDLVLINPCGLTEETFLRARKAKSIIDKATILPSINELIDQFDILVGTSSRHRSLHLPVVSSRHIPDAILNPDKKAAILFGHEKNGLSNELLNLCSLVIEIPNYDQMSLNLSHAVQIICYELSSITAQSDLSFSSLSQREDFLNWLTQRTEDDFIKPHTLTRIRTILNKALLTETEINLLYSLFHNIKSLDKPATE
ncbi:TrmJ/YjtD family RNA methyltransferase [Gammaproteobacteria bacterium]|nr:TrmJ/YjtD family RNA methyltransferase [Gammaproteobacteria bacterium]